MASKKERQQAQEEGVQIEHAMNLLRSLDFFKEHLSARLDTPKRLVRFLKEFAPPKVKPVMTMFPADGVSGMIVEEGIAISALCEHHCAPFFGHAYIGYLPEGKIIGISKLARLAKYYAHRFQTQERITQQIADDLITILPKGVGVFIRCEHTCMSVRGVQAHGAKTATTELRGAFLTDARTRSEFLQHIQGCK